MLYNLYLSVLYNFLGFVSEGGQGTGNEVATGSSGPEQ